MSNAKVLLKAPPGCNGANWNGQYYEVVAGLLEVPSAAIPELTRPIHGFTLEPDARALVRPLGLIGAQRKARA